jgi:predicted PurR-regulated permease PerM
MSKGNGPDEMVSSLLLPSSHLTSASGGDLPGAGKDALAGRDRPTWAEVPWRTIIGSVGIIGAATMFVLVIYIASRVVIWVLVAAFFAIVLARPVGWLQGRYRLRRGAATGIVVAATLAVLFGLIALFILPVRTQLVAVLTDLPGTVQQAAEGRGPVGHVVSQLHLEQLVRDNQDRLTSAATRVQGSLPKIIGSAIETALAAVTIAVMTCLMLSQSRALSRAGVRLVPVRHRAWITDVARDAAGAVSGYMIGNLIISVCAGVAAFALLMVLGVPSPVVLALWVAFADLIPLVGATLGAVVAVIAAFFVSPTAGIIAIVFFALYQQFENSVLQIVIMSRTVRVNPLVVLLSVLLGVELFGLVGALLAVPAAGAITVVVKELWLHRPADPDQLIVVTSGDTDEEHLVPSRSRRRWLRAPWRRHVRPEVPTS